jgi:hypothetical protein
VLPLTHPTLYPRPPLTHCGFCRPDRSKHFLVFALNGSAVQPPMSLVAGHSPANASSPDSIPASPCASSTSTTPRGGPMVHGQATAMRPAGKAAVPRMPAGGAKRQGKASKTLPPPLTEALLIQAMSELPDGTRRATETCYQCFQVKSLHFFPPNAHITPRCCWQ